MGMVQSKDTPGYAWAYLFSTRAAMRLNPFACVISVFSYLIPGRSEASACWLHGKAARALLTGAVSALQSHPLNGCPKGSVRRRAGWS